MKIIVTPGLVKINEIEISKHHGCIEIFIDVDQKYPKVSYYTDLGPNRKTTRTIQIQSYSGRGRIGRVELIPEGRSESHLFRNCWFEMVQRRYCVRYMVIPNARRSDKWVSLYKAV